MNNQKIKFALKIIQELQNHPISKKFFSLKSDFSFDTVQEKLTSGKYNDISDFVNEIEKIIESIGKTDKTDNLVICADYTKNLFRKLACENGFNTQDWCDEMLRLHEKIEELKYNLTKKLKNNSQSREIKHEKKIDSTQFNKIVAFMNDLKSTNDQVAIFNILSEFEPDISGLGSQRTEINVLKLRNKTINTILNYIDSKNN